MILMRVRVDEIIQMRNAAGAELVVIDGNLITSCGPSTATGVAFQLLEMLTDKKSADKVRVLMGF